MPLSPLVSFGVVGCLDVVWQKARHPTSRFLGWMLHVVSLLASLRPNLPAGLVKVSSSSINTCS